MATPRTGAASTARQSLAVNGEDCRLPNGEHPLQTPWCVWYDKKQHRNRGSSSKGTSYKDNLKNMGSFNTLEGFWRYYVHLKRPSTLQRDVNLYIFRKGCAPMWEEFPDGGCWILKVRKQSGVLSKMWQDLVLGALGEGFDEPGVVGVALAIRTKEDMLSVWHRNNANDKIFIGEKLKTILNLDKDILVEYKTFKKSLKDKSTYSNTQPFVFAAAPSAGGSAAAGAARPTGAHTQKNRRGQNKKGRGGGNNGRGRQAQAGQRQGQQRQGKGKQAQGGAKKGSGKQQGGGAAKPKATPAPAPAPAAP